MLVKIFLGCLFLPLLILLWTITISLSMDFLGIGNDQLLKGEFITKKRIK